MTYIRTSKTRANIMRQPRERAKMLKDRRAKTAEKHRVYTVRPTIPVPEEDIHEEMDRQGSGIAEAMEAQEEMTKERNKIKRQLREEQGADNIRKDRLKALEERDRKSGVNDKVRAFKNNAMKKKK